MERANGCISILVAEDNDTVLLFMKRALTETGMDNSFRFVHDGAEAVAYLTGEGPFANRQEFPFPDVLLCDLKMPRMDGYELLGWLQSHEDCKFMPTIVFSSSGLESDVQRCYSLGAHAYLEKPGSIAEMAEVLEAMYHFWRRCKTPRKR